MTSNNPKSPQLTQIIAAIIIGIGGIAGAYLLLSARKISEATFVILFSITVITALVVAFIDRVQSFSLRDLRVELAKVENARREVEEKERQVHGVAMTLAEITVFLAAFHRRLGSEESQELENEWLGKRVADLLAVSKASEEERSHVFRFIREVEEMDLLRKTDQKASEAKWNTIWERVRNEIKIS